MRILSFAFIKRLLIISSVVALLPHMVFAADTNQFYNENDINYYDPSGTATASCSSDSTILVGSSNDEKAFRYFIAKGLTDEQAAGIIGNLMVESGVVPDNQQNNKPFPEGGWGIAQWTNPGRRDAIKKAVEDAGLPYTNEQTPPAKLGPLLAFELNYLWTEASGRGDITEMKKVTTTGEAGVNEAVITWERSYERAGDPALGARGTAGVKAYNAYKGSSGGGGTSGSSSCTAAIAGDFTYYSQYDPQWANKSYGSSTIKPSGCGPTSTAMVISSLTGKSVTPDIIADKFGYEYIPGDGSSHDLFMAAPKAYGLTTKTLDPTQSDVATALKQGALIISGGQGSYPYTGAGHIIVIRGITPDGKFVVGNPLPKGADQGKSSSDVIKNTDWFNHGYTWDELKAAGLHTVYAVSKDAKT